MYILYKTVNNLTGKEYVGIHKTTDYVSDNYLGSGKILRRAIKKYGKENFTRYILVVLDNLEIAREIERRYVTAEYVLNENTYNIAIGGGLGGADINGLTFKGRSHNSVSRQKIAAASKGRCYRTESGRQRIIFSNQNNLERKQKISATLSGRVLTDEHKKAIALSVKRAYTDGRLVPRRGVPKPRIKCPRCGMVGSVNNMGRKHMLKCHNGV
jgi:hypothetical protein